VLENVAPSAHAAHWRSAVAEPAAVMPWPAGHFDHSVHEGRAALLLNVPEVHAAHVRSAAGVASDFVYSPTLQGRRMSQQRAAPSKGENVSPAMHPAHLRSAVADPAADMPEPTGHVDQRTQLSRPGVAVKWPALHDSHTRSDVLVAAATVCSPALHSMRASAHALALSTGENVEPATHCSHCRSLEAVPSCDSPSPAGQVRHAEQLFCPCADENWPSRQVAQTRSFHAVAAIATYCPWAQGSRTASHTCPSHPRLAECVLPVTQAAQVRSAELEPADAVPVPAGHKVHGAQLRAAVALTKWPEAHGAHTISLEAVASATR